MSFPLRVELNLDKEVPGEGKCLEILVSGDWGMKVANLKVALTMPKSEVQGRFEEDMLAKMMEDSWLGVHFTGRQLSHSSARALERRYAPREKDVKCLSTRLL